ncbi:hypothetical protein STEG23_031583, partial [Scotinomys teguina]
HRMGDRNAHECGLQKINCYNPSSCSLSSLFMMLKKINRALVSEGKRWPLWATAVSPDEHVPQRCPCRTLTILTMTVCNCSQLGN